MHDEGYTTTIWMDASPEAVTHAIARPQDYWRPDIEGAPTRPGDEFVYRDDGIRSARFQVAEVVPGERVVWDVLEAHLSFVEAHEEWTGTRVVFELAKEAGGTRVRFTHVGLVPDLECFASCSRGWHGVLHDGLRLLQDRTV